MSFFKTVIQRLPTKNGRDVQVRVSAKDERTTVNLLNPLSTLKTYLSGCMEEGKCG